jgi:hypothetical protein
MLAGWFDVIRELNSAITVGTVQFVTVTAMIDRNRRPILWGGVERHDLHPRRRNVVIKED